MSDDISEKKPNVLLIMVDQMRFPRVSFGPDHGFLDPIKQILGFQGTPYDTNEFKKFFPGFWALRQNSVVMNNHRIASSACVPSRTAVFTGQYGTRTKVTQTDGVFKDGSDPAFKWLEPKSFPTIGSWMKAGGYTTHYFGKWHITGEGTTDLEKYGFSDWELSYPDPHGTVPNNLGYYRDYQFEDVSCAFLARQGLGIPYSIAHAKANADPDNYDAPKHTDAPPPWFAVSSFANPHDIAAYPGLPGYVCESQMPDAPYALAVPPQGAKSNPAFGGTMSITLNKAGFPQGNANVAPHWDEDLAAGNKPSCQVDYKYKMGLSLVAKMGRLASEQYAEQNKGPEGEELTREAKLAYAVQFTLNTNQVGIPFALTENPEIASRAFIQYYAYLLHEVDQHISNVLKKLEETGQADNTIVMFCPDHGEYGASHSMLMEKWHSGYEEIIHVPVVVRFPESIHHVPGGMRQVDKVTSHMDILPTIIGLSGMTPTEIETAKGELTKEYKEVMDPVGVDLSDLILDRSSEIIDPGTDKEREGVLFMTYDTITEPLAVYAVPVSSNVSEEETDEEEITNYDVYEASVEELIKRNPSITIGPDDLDEIKLGSVVQPNNVHAVVDNDKWKLVFYFDPNAEKTGVKVNHYELYDLNNDPNEEVNLLVFDGTFPTPNLAAIQDDGNTVKAKAEKLMEIMKRLEAQMLHPLP